MRSLSNEDIPSVRDDDGDEHFVTDAVPESCIIHKRDVSKHEQARVERTRASRRVGRSYQDREDMNSPRQRVGMKKKTGLSPEEMQLQRCPDQTAIRQVLTSAGSRPQVPMPMGHGRAPTPVCATAILGPRADVNGRACVDICVRYW